MTHSANPVLRGHGTRLTNFMEDHHRAQISAIAASAGCSTRNSSFDDGVDITLVHKVPEHLNGDHTALLDVQLKATTANLVAAAAGVSVQISRKRFDEFAVVNPSTHKIVVILVMPSDPQDWVRQEIDYLAVSTRAYWVNLAGKASTAHEPSVYAPLTQVFDDVSLCSMMERIGKGLAP